MPDDYDEFDDETETDPQPRDRKEENLRQLREKAKRADDAEARAVAAERRAVLAEANIAGLDDMKRKALESTHEGEWTPDAVRATAVKLGWAEPPPPDVPAAEFKAQDNIARASAGAAPVPEDDLNAAIKATKSEAELDALLLGRFGNQTASELGLVPER